MDFTIITILSIETLLNKKQCYGTSKKAKNLNPNKGLGFLFVFTLS